MEIFTMNYLSDSRLRVPHEKRQHLDLEVAKMVTEKYSCNRLLGSHGNIYFLLKKVLNVKR